MTAPEQRAHHLNPKKDTPDMQTDSNPVQAPFRLRVEDDIVIGTWDYQADPDVRFTDAQVEQLDGPLPKRLYLDLTGAHATTSAFATLSTTTATAALKAIAERADKLSTAYVRADRKHDVAEIERLETLAEGDDETEPPYFTVRILTDDKEAVSEYVARRARPFNFITPWPRYGVERPLPAVAVSIADNVAAITLEPDTAEMSEDTKTTIGAADRQRIFIDARGLKPADYPQDTLAFLFSNATLVCVTALDCSNPDADVEAAHAIFDTRAEDSPWVVRLFNDAPRDWGDFIEKHRPGWQHCLAWPTHDAEPAAG